MISGMSAVELFGSAMVFTSLIGWSARRFLNASPGRKMAEAAMRESEERLSRTFLRSTLDALSAHIAILDEHGTIMEVNQAWDRFAGENSAEGGPVGAGVNYLNVCDSARNGFSDEAAEVAAGIRSVIVRQTDGFQIEYPCHSPSERRWFVVRVTRFGGEGPVRVVVAHENVTERRLAEEKLRESETEFNQLANHITDIFWITSPDLEKTYYVSPAYERIWGRSTQSLYDRSLPWTEAILPEDRESVRAGFARLMADAPEISLQYRIARPDGSVRWVHDRGFQVRDPAGSLVRLTGIVTDITERKHNEEELLWKTALLEAQVNSSLDGILVVNEQNQKVLQNQRFAEMLEIPKRIADDPDDTEQIAWVTNMIREPENFIRKVRHLYSHPQEIGRDEIELKNGRVFDRYSAPVIARDGTAYGRIWQLRDVTGQKRAEARFRRLVDSNVQSILFWNTSGGVTGANDSFLRLTGFTRDDLDAGRINWVTMTPPEYAQRDHKALAEIAAGGVTLAYEKEFIRKDGSRVPVLLGSAAFEDMPSEGVCFAVDLTERRRLEAQLFQSQKLETAGKLACGIAHEFNSILTAIIGRSEMLLSELANGSRSSELATEIRDSAGRAAILTRQLLAYGSKQILQPTLLDLNAVLAGMEVNLRPLLRPGTEVNMVHAAGLRPVQADAGHIEEVIVNLVMNAADAMPDGGTLTLETSNVLLDRECEAGLPDLHAGDHVMLTVTDTGVGMSEATKARAFEPFFTTKPIGQGQGLGLSTCYGIIKQSGGMMTAESERLRGCKFTIYLPAAERAAPVPSPGGLAAGLARGVETILLVEGDPAMREMMETLLLRLGYTVFSAPNHLEALSLKRPDGRRIDLLLIDVDMPLIERKELSERFRELHPQAKMLFASASAFNTSRDQGHWNENVYYLRKPFPPSALAIRLREVLTS